MDRHTIELTSDGTAFGSHLKVDGVEQQYVTGVVVSAEAGDLTRVTITQTYVNADVKLDNMVLIYQGPADDGA